ncbi:transcriptional attenuator, LytR family [Anaerovirgula multivorans]|uniref:Transcriptional attenuator, LytR family n=1 Tax=Anaerovirgula multivorans TaxID=312168 RepID=A0A239DT82_9FIRM|nr:LCP family protein [Anaerovirgula multivorans]SNS34764.1 transcriptional attenuator, LytR family [Anaerovirgula multivorans]
MKKQRKKIAGTLIISFFMIAIIGFFTISSGNIYATNGRINILIFGVDAQDSSNTKGTRADSIMLLSIDSSAKNPVLISIPRDTRVAIDGRKSQEKVNHAHAYGGVELLTNTVEDFLGIPIDYYAKINYKAVEEIVDALGGITLEVPVDMKYKDPYADPPLEIDISKGLQTLDGGQALQFLRFRSGYANQDLGRVEAQQQFANVLIKEAMSPLTVFKAPTLTKIFYRNVDTNIPKTKMIYLGLKNFIGRSNELTKMTLPGRPAMINGVSYYVVDDSDIQQLKENYLTNKTKSVNASRVEVLNGCGISGTAARFAEKLEESKISVESINNYESNNIIESFIEYNPKYKKDAKKIGKILGIKNLIEATNEVDVKVIIGKDLTS